MEIVSGKIELFFYWSDERSVAEKARNKSINHNINIRHNFLWLLPLETMESLLCIIFSIIITNWDEMRWSTQIINVYEKTFNTFKRALYAFWLQVILYNYFNIFSPVKQFHDKVSSFSFIYDIATKVQ
jgi:hypothetical protein